MSGRRSRRPWIRGGALLALLLALVFLFEREGPLPRSGGSASSGGGGAGEATGLPGSPEAPPEDLLEGRRNVFSWLLSEGSFRKARALAARLRGSREPSERRLGHFMDRELLARGREIRQSFGDRLARKDWEGAERALRELRRGFPRLAEASFRDLPAPEGGWVRPAPEELEALARELSSSLPWDLDSEESLRELRGGEALIRLRGSAGGYRFRRVRLADLDPLLLRERVLRSLDRGGEEALQTLARLLMSAGRPLGAFLLLEGRPPRGPGPGDGGR